MAKQPTAPTELPTDLHVFGATLVDEIARPRYTLQPRASNPVNLRQHVGGVGCNVALQAWRTVVRQHSARHNQTPPAPVVLHSAVGSDAHATLLQSALSRNGVQTQWTHHADQPTARYTAVLDNRGDLHIGLASTALYDSLSVTSFVTPQLADLSASEQPRLHRHALLDANLPTSVLHALATRLKRDCHVQTLTAMAVSPTKALRLLPLLESIDLLYCNVREAAALTANAAAEHADTKNESAALRDLGVERAVITDGSKPVTILDDGELHKLPCPTTDIAPSASANGAGDALAGASWVAWVEGKSLLDAVAQPGFAAARQVLTGDFMATPLMSPT